MQDMCTHSGDQTSSTISDMDLRDRASKAGYTLRIRGCQSYELYESPQGLSPCRVGDKQSIIAFLGVNQ